MNLWTRTTGDPRSTAKTATTRRRAHARPGTPHHRLRQHAPAPARTVQLVSGDFLLTVNPVDGSEIEVRPPAGAARPAREAHRAERAEAERAGRPPRPAGTRPDRARPAGPRGRTRTPGAAARPCRSVRLTGPAGSGRTSLLDVVAEDCAGLAPDGVVRLSGFRRTADDLLYDLFHAVHRAPLHRPDREELLGHLREGRRGRRPWTTSSSAAPPSTAAGRHPRVRLPHRRHPGRARALRRLGRRGGLPHRPGPLGRRGAAGARRRPDPHRGERPTGPATSGSSPRACRCASSRPVPCCAGATGSGRCRRRRRVRRLRRHPSGRRHALRRRRGRRGAPAVLGEAAAPAPLLASGSAPRPAPPWSSPSRSAARCRTRRTCPPWSATPTRTPLSAS
ncbi:ATP-binding protein [Streptomyces thinghirensis]|nr:ATP-binding protein [Streptomyces thinghirensis]